MDAGPLNQFLILANSVQGKACEKLVRDVLDHAGIFVFGELLACPNVQAIASSPEGKQLLDVLRIFAYGVYADYKARQAELPELTAAQLRKLRLLTIVTLATKEKYIKFSDLECALDVPNTRELENMLIEAIYQNLVVGKLDQEKQSLIVESCFCRDCQDEDLDFIIDTLRSWHEASQSMLGSLDGMVQHSQASFEQNKRAREELEAQIQASKESLKEGDPLGGKDRDAGGCTRMSTDDGDDEESKRAKSTRGWGFGSHGSSASRY
eukprot:TRINITY_DN124388_c0_g1_i1.p2 TRINITY_DN124388_c0_g1~~TRINITY_DN124388_c0_g1_i1.p2  ORF type:complete len:266 (-),score=65.72 TRINITY_DN124388_c0_g1_i1:80-877(-)